MIVVVTFSGLYLWFISSLLLVFTPVFIHTISLFLFVIHLGINIIKTCYNLCTLYDNSALVYFQITGEEHSQSKEDIHMY